MLVVGIDAGGSKTVCLLADADGHVLEDVRGPGANLQGLGELDIEKILHDLIGRALGDRSTLPDAICLGMAGVDRPDEAATVRAILSRIGHRAKTLVVNDALIALEAGAPGAPGIVLLSGTGSIAYGRDASGGAARAGGWGHIAGDEGSGYWLGQQALRAVMQAGDRRGPRTALTSLLLTHFRVEVPSALVHEIYGPSSRPSMIAALAPFVEVAATAKDDVATEILDLAARDLAVAAVAVSTRLHLDRGPIIVAGGTFKAAPSLMDRVRGELLVRLPHADVRPLPVLPAQGAVRLAIALARGEVRVPVYLQDTPV